MQTDPVPGRRSTAAGPDAGGARMRIALNRHRQRELYGSPLGDRVRRLTAALDITQARLARTLGLSPAMLSQLASARRVKIGDPGVLARLQLLDQRCDTAPPRSSAAVEALLEEVGRARLQWTARDVAAHQVRPERRSADAIMSPLHHRVPDRPGPGGTDGPTPADALRAVAPPARLVAAAAALAPAFPELAAVLRQAALGPRTRPGPARRAATGERSPTNGTSVG
jgi:transcriptional regulator with XRE-family HTH domain